jgi:hypothetical protein
VRTASSLGAGPVAIIQRMSKAEIVAELARLSPEDLMDVRAWLDRLDVNKSAAKVAADPSIVPRLRSPRLADSARCADFVKQITELPSNAAVGAPAGWRQRTPTNRR